MTTFCMTRKSQEIAKSENGRKEATQYVGYVALHV